MKDVELGLRCARGEVDAGEFFGGETTDGFLPGALGSAVMNY